MPDNWIGHIKLTDETGVVVDGEKIHDYISCEQGDDVEVDSAAHPVLHAKLPREVYHDTQKDWSFDGGASRGFYFDGENYWIATTEKLVEEYDSSFNRVRTFSTGTVGGYANGIVRQGDNIWTSHGTASDDFLVKWSLTGAKLNTYVTSWTTAPRAMEVKGNLLYILDEGSLEVTEVSLAGVLLNTWDISQVAEIGGGGLTGLVWDSENGFWLLGRSGSNRVDVVNADFTQLITSYPVHSSTRDISQDGDYLIGISDYEANYNREVTLLPNVPRPEGSPIGYKVIADKT